MKETKIYTHIVEYYQNDKLIKSDDLMNEIINRKKYWKYNLSNSQNRPYLTIGKYKIVRKCQRNFDYAIEKLILKNN